VGKSNNDKSSRTTNTNMDAIMMMLIMRRKHRPNEIKLNEKFPVQVDSTKFYFCPYKQNKNKKSKCFLKLA